MRCPSMCAPKIAIALTSMLPNFLQWTILSHGPFTGPEDGVAVAWASHNGALHMYLSPRPAAVNPIGCSHVGHPLERVA